MPIRYDIRHTTVYRYKVPVTFGEHRVMFRPRDSHDLRVLATDLLVSPDANVRLIQDPHSNSVALVQPLEKADTLQIVGSEYTPASMALREYAVRNRLPHHWIDADAHDDVASVHIYEVTV